MLAWMDQGREPFVATDAEAAVAKEAFDKLKPLADAKTDVEVRLVEKGGVIVSLPPRALELIVEFLAAVGDRKPVSVIPHAAELTTQQAADYLNVSRPHLVGLLEKGEIPYRMVGTHRRVRVSDLTTYKKISEDTRRAAIKRMVAEAQKLELP